MKICILMGSPRLRGHTAALVKPLISELNNMNNEIISFNLPSKKINSCKECFKCQRVSDRPGCVIKDDMEEIYDKILSSDCIVFATPIFTWYSTPSIKVLLDRLFCCSKKYSNQPERLLLQGKSAALITTCGYNPSEGSDLMEIGLKRFCDYAGLNFKGHLSIQDKKGMSDFICDTAVGQVKDFAHMIIKMPSGKLDREELLKGISIRNYLKPGDVGYLIYLHGWIYAKECGYNHNFEGYVCKTFYDFFENYSSDKDRIWFAEIKGKIIGAIAILGHSAIKAQLRWFIIHPDYRGRGVGRKLFDEAMCYCRKMNFKKIFLATTQDQKTAVNMYINEGFKKVSQTENEAWGKPLTEEIYELLL